MSFIQLLDVDGRVEHEYANASRGDLTPAMLEVYENRSIYAVFGALYCARGLAPRPLPALRIASARQSVLGSRAAGTALVTVRFFQGDNQRFAFNVYTCASSDITGPIARQVIWDALNLAIENNGGDISRRVWLNFDRIRVSSSAGANNVRLDSPTLIRWLQRHPGVLETLDRFYGSDAVVTNDEDPMDAVFDEGIEPVTPSDRTFGLEFEFIPAPHMQQADYGEAMIRALRGVPGAARVDITGYQHSDGSSWNIKTDSSCGLEVASPALTWSRWPEVTTVLKALTDNGAIVNYRCGVHVHHEARDLHATGLRRLLLLWMAYEQVLLAAVRGGRGENRYCESFTRTFDGNFDDFKRRLTPLSNVRTAVNSIGRYKALNATQWWNTGRVEVRLHHGTLLPGTIKFWTMLTQQMIEFAKITRSYTDMEAAFRSEFDQQLTNFKQAMTTVRRHPEACQLPKVLDSVIQQRRSQPANALV